MRKYAALVLVGASVLAVPAARAMPAPARYVTQVGTYDYLTAPDYDGLRTVGDALGGATLGLGTFDRLDGELVLIGGTVYRVGTDGHPEPADLATTTPFFEAVKFAPQATVTIPAGTACSALLPLVDEAAGTSDGMVALRLSGTFTSLTTRSVPAQSEPYQPLATVVADQTVFELGEQRATLVGFRTGADLKGTGAPGMHLHGLTKDRTAGGHVLSCTAGDDVRLSLMRAQGLKVVGASN